MQIRGTIRTECPFRFEVGLGKCNPRPDPQLLLPPGNDEACFSQHTSVPAVTVVIHKCQLRQGREPGPVPGPEPMLPTYLLSGERISELTSAAASPVESVERLRNDGAEGRRRSARWSGCGCALQAGRRRAGGGLQPSAWVPSVGCGVGRARRPQNVTSAEGRRCGGRGHDVIPAGRSLHAAGARRRRDVTPAERRAAAGRRAWARAGCGRGAARAAAGGAAPGPGGGGGMAESEAETPSTPGEFESKYFEFHGVRLPPFCRGKMEEIANFPVRPSDVWIVTYPKSGEPAQPPPAGSAARPRRRCSRPASSPGSGGPGRPPPILCPSPLERGRGWSARICGN